MEVPIINKVGDMVISDQEKKKDHHHETFLSSPMTDDDIVDNVMRLLKN